MYIIYFITDDNPWFFCDLNYICFYVVWALKLDICHNGRVDICQMSLSFIAVKLTVDKHLSGLECFTFLFSSFMSTGVFKLFESFYCDLLRMCNTKISHNADVFYAPTLCCNASSLFLPANRFVNVING